MAGVGLAVAGGLVVGQLSGGGEVSSAGLAPAQDQLESQLSVPDVEAIPSAGQPRVPIVNRLSSLDPAQASTLAAIAERAGIGTDPAPGTAASGAARLRQVPYASGESYRYLRRVGAVATVFAGLGGRAAATYEATPAVGIDPRVRRDVDRLALIIARTNLSPYPPSQRLSDLVSVAILQLGTLGAGDFDRARHAELLAVSERLGRIGRAINADLASAVAAAAAAADQRRAVRLLTEIDGKLGRIGSLAS